MSSERRRKMLCFENIVEPTKKQLLIAALEMFSDNVYDKVSVFSIAKKAGISRTSFYYYFTDKQQLYHYLLTLLQKDFVVWLQKKEIHSDIFEMMFFLFQYFASYQGTTQQKFIENIAANMTPALQSEFIDLVQKAFPLEVWKKMEGTDRLKTQSPDEISLLLLMLLSCVTTAIQQYFSHARSREKVEHYLKISIGFIKYGVYKEN